MDGKPIDKNLIIRKALEAQHRAAFTVTRAEAVEGDDRTVKIICATDKPITHFLWSKWDYVDIQIAMNKKAMRAERFENGAAFLMDHNTRDQRGVIEDFEISGGELRATVRMSRSTRGEELLQDIVDGIRPQISLGFMIHNLTLIEERKDQPDLYEARDWEPYEASSVAVAADLDAKVMRAMNARRDGLETCPDCSEPLDDCTCETADDNTDSKTASRQQRAISNPKEDKKMTPEEIAAEEANNTRTAEQIAREQVRDEITATATVLGRAELAAEFHRERLLNETAGEPTVAEFKAFARKKLAGVAPQIPTESPEAVATRSGVKVELARTLPQHGAVRGFGGDAEKAYRFGQWMIALAGREGTREAARKYCVEHGIVRSFAEGVNETGGFLVPEEFGTDLILLREKYGVFRQNAKIVPMASSDRTDPRQIGGVTAYFANEESALTESTMSWDQVSLSAKKLIALTRISSELNEDSAINLGDTVANEIAYAFAKKEDECGFVGDGTSTYGGIKGVTNRLKDLSGTIANIAGLQVGSGNAYSELALVDFEGVVGHLPQYADSDRAAWFVHRSFYWNVMVKLALAAGGNTASEIEDARNQRFMGYRVVFTQVMPKVEANSQVCALLGDLSMAASLGTRRDVTISTSEHSRFANDQIEIKGTQRFDIVVHDIGNASATAALRQEGAIVGLITAAS